MKTMKTLLTILLMLFSTAIFAQEQEQLNLPGDNLNLYGVLNLFQKSETLEIFEKNLNVEGSRINNLDLNNDGRTDYIHVKDHMIGSAHAIALKVSVNEFETQDVAVIEVERDNNNQIHVQIIGDEDLYGKDYIVEPYQSTDNPGYEGTNTYYAPAYTWNIISYMYNPYYVVYASPYRWGYYPYYWSPWSPVYYGTYYGYHSNYYNYYRRGNIYRAPGAHGYYSPYRSNSIHYRQTYKNTYNPGRNTYRPPTPKHNNYRPPTPQRNNNYRPPQRNNYKSPTPQRNNYQSKPNNSRKGGKTR